MVILLCDMKVEQTKSVNKQIIFSRQGCLAPNFIIAKSHIDLALHNITVSQVLASWLPTLITVFHNIIVSQRLASLLATSFHSLIVSQILSSFGATLATGLHNTVIS